MCWGILALEEARLVEPFIIALFWIGVPTLVLLGLLKFLQRRFTKVKERGRENSRAERGGVMASELHGFQILQVAEQIEHNGVEFYEKAAKRFDDEKLSGMLSRLADWERGHEKVFAEMRREYAERLDSGAIFDPEHFLSADPRLVSRYAASAVNPNEAFEFTGAESRAKVLNKALELERDSIAFYKELRRAVRGPVERNKIDAIIKEE